MTFSPELDAPVPVQAVWQALGPFCLIYFTCDITGEPLDAGNWFFRYGGFSYTVTAAVESSGRVRLSLSAPMLDAGPDVVSYAPPPFDVLSLGGLVPAPAFADFPVT